ncbi:MAG: TRAP transporter small permease [Gemmobacter sp.]
MQLLVKIVDRAILALGILAAAAVVVMMAHVTLNVVVSLLFGTPIPGTLALVANYYMPLITFLPLAFVERIENHVAVEVVTQVFPAPARTHLYGWTFLFCFAVCGLLAFGTWIEAVEKYQIGSFRIERGLKVPTWPVRFAAPVSYGLLSLLFLLKFVSYLLGGTAMKAGPGGLGYFHDDIGAGS